MKPRLKQCYIAYFLIFICHNSNPLKRPDLQRATNFFQLMHLAKVYTREKEFNNFYRLLTPLSQEKIIQLLDFLEMASGDQVKRMAHETGMNDLVLLLIKILHQNPKTKELAIFFFIQSLSLHKISPIKTIRDCQNYFWLPYIKNLKSIQREVSFFSMQKLDFLSKKQITEIRTVYYVCRGNKPIKLILFREDDWRLEIESW